LHNMTQCETVTLEMHSQICIAFYFKFSALWPLRLWALEVRYLLIYIKPHKKSGDNKLGTLLFTSWTLRFHKISPRCLIQITPNIRRKFEDSDFMSSSRDPVSRNNNEKLDLGLRVAYNGPCVCLEPPRKSALIFFTPHRSYCRFTMLHCSQERHKHLNIFGRSGTILHAGFMLMDSKLFPCQKFAQHVNFANIAEWYIQTLDLL
jgi:hypothetical protein